MMTSLYNIIDLYTITSVCIDISCKYTQLALLLRRAKIVQYIYLVITC